MRSNEMPRAVWPPEPGFFKLRLVRGGWQVPARIVCGGDGLWFAIIDGVSFQPAEDPLHAPGIDKIWHGGTVTTESDYDYLNALRDAAKRWQPQHPACNPDKPINPSLLRPIAP